MRRLVRVQAIGAAAAILFTRSVVADGWPYYQHDATHTGYSTAVVNPQALSWAWTAPSFFTGGYSTPVIVGSTIYAMQNQQGYSGGGLRTRVTSFNLATGAINWTYSGSFVFPSQPGVGGGFVTFVGTTFTSSSLYVLDAVTGALRYTVPILAQTGSEMPTVVPNPVSGHVTAFVADGARVSAVSLGLASGTVLWTQDGQFGGQSIPTVVGSSIVLAGPGQYYAFDQATGSANHFWAGNVYGGGGSTVAYDATRHEFYVVEAYDDSTPVLSAYHYTDNAHITLLWQRTGDGVGSQSVAISPTGKVYSAGGSVIWELNPATGATLRSIPGSFAGVPALTNNVLWIFGNGQTFAYDLVTLQLLRAFNGGGFESSYRSPGAFTNGYFVLDYGNIVGYPSFDVYGSPLPGATTNPATNVASFSATLNGSVNARGSTTSVHFDYGLTTSYGYTTVIETRAGHAPRAITANVSGLLPSHLYHFRIVAHNVHGTTFGRDRTFTTLSPTGLPVVTTNPATRVASFSAILNALLDPHGLTTSVHFQYGPTTSYGLTTSPRSQTGNTYRNVSANISSLTASTTYHFRIVASNAAGTRIGRDRTFTTLTATGPPVVTTKSASNVTTSSVTLNGLLDPHGLTTTVNFQYGTTAPFYAHSTPMQTQTGNTYRNIAANISGLTAHTTYHFRIVATNSGGSKAGADRTFTMP
ncbi:MAG: hypothetical protein ACM3NN_06935 [Nitrospirota bacterium]